MRIRTAFVLGLLLVLSSAGCAKGADGDGVASASGTTKPSASASTSTSRDPQKDQEAFLEFAKCMREHGVPMNDPQFDGGGVNLSIPEGTSKEQVDAAQKECKQYMPNGGEPMKPDPEMQEKMRKFAQCMRENGVANFPDPSDDGGMMIDSDTLGMDPQSDAFKKAEQACQQYQPKPPGGGDGGPKAQTGGDSGGGKA
jgi:hypothetical protein